MSMSVPSSGRAAVRRTARTHRALRSAGAGTLLCALVACAVGPNFHRPDAPRVSHYANGADPKSTIVAHGTAQAFDRDLPLDADWWQLFQSPSSTRWSAKRSSTIRDLPRLGQACTRARTTYAVDTGSSFRRSMPRSAPCANDIAPSTSARLERPFRRACSISSRLSPSSVSYALDVFGGQRRWSKDYMPKSRWRGPMNEPPTSPGRERRQYRRRLCRVCGGNCGHPAAGRASKATSRYRRRPGRAGTVPYSNVLSLESQLASYEA